MQKPAEEQTTCGQLFPHGGEGGAEQTSHGTESAQLDEVLP